MVPIDNIKAANIRLVQASAYEAEIEQYQDIIKTYDEYVDKQEHSISLYDSIVDSKSKALSLAFEENSRLVIINEKAERKVKWMRRGVLAGAFVIILLQSL